MKFQVKSPALYLMLFLFALLSLALPVLSQPAQTDVIDGWFSTLYGIPQKDSGLVEEAFYGLTTEDGRYFALDIAPVVLQAAGGSSKLNGTFVRVRLDVQTDRTVLTNGGMVRVQRIELAPLPLRIPQGASSFRDVTGSQPWVTILCAFPGTPVGYGTESTSYFQGMYTDEFSGMDDYWRQQSFGKVNLSGSQTFGWFTLDDPQTAYYPSPGSGANSAILNGLAQDCINKADATVDFSPYKGINFMFNGELDCCAWGGASLVQTDGSAQYWRLTWNPPWSWRDITVVSHEIGHGFGLPHANNYDNDGYPYDNSWDVMSDTYEFCYKSIDDEYGCLGQHTNAYHKDWLGWFGPNRRLEVTYDRSNITLDHVAMQNSQNYQVVLIDIPGTDKKYSVEARQTTDSNYDVKLAGKAVIIHEIDDSRKEWAWLVGGTTDAKSKSLENNQANPDGAWLVGETYTDVGKGISISVVSETANGFVISVDMPGVPPTATPVPPTPVPTSTPGGPTETPNPATNLVLNGGMEAATDNESLPDAWALKNLTGDKRKCNKTDKTVAYIGNCAFMFKGGAGENSKLSQTYTPTTPMSGTVAAELYTQGSNPAVTGKFTVKLYYANGSKGKLNINILPSESFVRRNGSQAFGGSITKLKFMLKNESAGGKFYVDNVVVKVQ
jgi:M6 family metalloprotease-like protein